MITSGRAAASFSRLISSNVSPTDSIPLRSKPLRFRLWASGLLAKMATGRLDTEAKQRPCRAFVGDDPLRSGLEGDRRPAVVDEAPGPLGRRRRLGARGAGGEQPGGSRRAGQEPAAREVVVQGVHALGMQGVALGMQGVDSGERGHGRAPIQ